MKRLTVFGSGYVGLVSAACFASIGHDVTCVDVNADRVRQLQNGEVPLHEPGLDDVVRRAQAADRLRFTSHAPFGVAHAQIIFIAVGTPPLPDGSADLRHVLDVADCIGASMASDCIVVNKSTVPVGTAERVESVLCTVLAKRGTPHRAVVLSNPEFLKEGDAVRDFMEPDRVIIGGKDALALQTLREVYAPLGLEAHQMITMTSRDAEFTKYAANTMLASRISVMNEFANIAERLGVDIEAVRHGIGSDPRIGEKFLHAGCGYGGSCFPKDVAALVSTAKDAGYEPLLLDSVQHVNTRQKRRLYEKICAHFGGNLRGRTIAIWGLSFKPGTDDMREAPSRVLIEALWKAGSRVHVHDPAALKEVRRLYGDRDELVLCEHPYDVLDGADALALVTEWSEYRQPDFAQLKNKLRHPVVFDGRNVLDAVAATTQGVTVEAVGRPARVIQ